MATPAGAAIAQFEISRDGHAAGPGAAAPTWRARFSLDVEPSGPVHAEVALSGGRTRVTLWAERPDALASLGARQGELSGALAADDAAADVAVRVLPGPIDGRPAIIIRSERWKPAVRLSKSGNPDATPVILSPRS